MSEKIDLETKKPSKMRVQIHWNRSKNPNRKLSKIFFEKCGLGEILTTTFGRERSTPHLRESLPHGLGAKCCSRVDITRSSFLGASCALLSHVFGSENWLRKNIEIWTKIVDFGLPKPIQNPSKSLPKCLRNRTPKKQVIFHWFLLEKPSVAKVPTSISFWFFQYFLLVGHFSSNRFVHAVFVQKPFQNELWTLQKLMPKMCCFLISISSGSGLDFGGSWASKLGDKLAILASKTYGARPRELS